MNAQDPELLLNQNRAHSTPEQKKNIDKLWRQENIDEKREQYRQQYKNHKDERKIYRIIKNKDKQKCSCGGQYTYQNKSRHFKTKTHQGFIYNDLY